MNLNLTTLSRENKGNDGHMRAVIVRGRGRERRAWREILVTAITWRWRLWERERAALKSRTINPYEIGLLIDAARVTLTAKASRVGGRHLLRARRPSVREEILEEATVRQPPCPRIAARQHTEK